MVTIAKGIDHGDGRVLRQIDDRPVLEDPCHDSINITGKDNRDIFGCLALTKSDVRFTVDVPEVDFSKEKVDKLLAKEAQKIEAIKAL